MCGNIAVRINSGLVTPELHDLADDHDIAANVGI
jgi:hypothetical protein